LDYVQNIVTYVLIAVISSYLTVYFNERSKRIALIRGLYGELKYDLNLLEIMLNTIKEKERGKIPQFPTKYFELSYNCVRKLMNEYYPDFYKINNLSMRVPTEYGPLNMLLIYDEIVRDAIKYRKSRPDIEGVGIIVDEKYDKGYICAEQVYDILKLQKKCIEDVINVMELYSPYKRYLKDIIRNKK